MAERPSVKDILAMARKGGPVPPSAPGAASKESPAEEPVPASAAPEPAAPPTPADVPTPEKLGRPLSLKEKLAAARAGGAPGAAAPAPAAPVDVPTPEKLGRPLTLQEKLAAARATAGGAAPAPAGAKPAAAKPATAPAAKSAAPAARTLPPLDKITDPKDLAEALRQAGAKKDKETAGPAAKPAAAKAPAREKESKPQTVLPRPTQRVAQAAVSASAAASRRAFLLLSSWIFVGWASFTAGCVAFTAMMGRFMFPNVLAEPPSTIKIGLPTNYEKEEVNERFKAEWGFWVVRSSRYNGTDVIYALKSVCTHLGCPPNWLAGEQKFKCPCHGSGFYISGINFEGPAPRPLERFKLSLGDDGQLVVDKSQIFQQELGQWADPDSFVVA
jgi:cytochrome b6-f complex iron-sulfur subunit